MNMSEKKSLSARKYLEQLQEIDISINQELERLEEMKSGYAAMLTLKKG